MKHLFLLILLIFSLPPLASRGQATWQPLNALPAGGRLASYSFVLNGVAYRGGGSQNGGTPNDLWAYDPAADTWAPRASLPGPGRGGAATFVVGSTAYVVAGEEETPGGSITDLNDAWAYNPLTDAWAALPPLPASVRVGAYAFAVGGKGYVGGGGIISGSGSTQLTDCWAFDPATGQWSACAAPPTQTVTLGAGFALGNYGYVAGGLDAANFPGVPSQQVWRFDAAGNQWTQRADLPGPRAYAGCFTAGGYGYVAEGIRGFDLVNSTFLPTHDVLRYDPTADTWTALPPAPGALGRIVPLCFALGGTAYLGQGQATVPNGAILNDFWQLPSLITGVPPGVATAFFTLAPNPAHHAVRLSGAPAGPVQVLDATGRLVRTARRAPGESETSLNLLGLTPGLYSVRCGTVVRRLVVE